MMRVRTNIDGVASLPAFGLLAVLLGSAIVACSAPGNEGNGGPAAAEVAPASPGPAALPSVDPATAQAKTTLEAALKSAVAGGRPGTAEIRAAIVAAGFPADATEVTASRTPTGLDADAVEAAVRTGSDCLVAQVRAVEVSVSVLPLLAGGHCLVGSPT